MFEKKRFDNNIGDKYTVQQTYFKKLTNSNLIIAFISFCKGKV